MHFPKLAIAMLMVLTVGLSSWYLRTPGQPREAPAGQEGRLSEDDDSVPRQTGPDHFVGPVESGLHFGSAELSVWRRRAQEGPYKEPGDASDGSPGDWERIAANAREFRDAPDDAIWQGPQHLDDAGCVEQDDENEPSRDRFTRFRDSAFYYLVTGDESYAEPVRRQLNRQASVHGTDFSNRDLWCNGIINDGHPSFAIANWLTKLLYAYDYLGSESFSASERDRLNRWFYEAADFWQQDLNDRLAENFRDRWAGDYRLSRARLADPGDPRIAYYGSEKIYALPRFYNNRKATVARFVGLAALKLDQERFAGVNGTSLADLQRSATLFVKEWLAFSVYAEQFFGEFERWREDLPDNGWSYSVNLIASVTTLADAFARAGDSSLYSYSTCQGAFGTESTRPKSLLFAMRSAGRYVDGTLRRYATDQSSQVGDQRYRINGRLDDGSDWHSVHDIQFALGNLYYGDLDIRRLYSRDAPSLPPYPEDPAPAGQHLVWSGDWGTQPGTLFMFGKLEGQVWPYPGERRLPARTCAM